MINFGHIFNKEKSETLLKKTLFTLVILLTQSCQSRIDKSDMISLSVTVNYDGNKTISYLLKEGEYDVVHKDITDENFPVQKTGAEEVEIFLIFFSKFDYVTSVDEAIKRLDNLGYKPANAVQLLALGAQYPFIQRQSLIVALGQHLPLSSYHYVVLDGSPSFRGAGLVTDYWFESRFFAALRK